MTLVPILSGSGYNILFLQVLEDGLTSAGNATMTYMNIQSLGVKGLVKKTAKDTGKELGKAVLEAHATGGSNEKKD